MFAIVFMPHNLCLSEETVKDIDPFHIVSKTTYIKIKLILFMNLEV